MDMYFQIWHLGGKGALPILNVVLMLAVAQICGWVLVSFGYYLWLVKYKRREDEGALGGRVRCVFLTFNSTLNE